MDSLATEASIARDIATEAMIETCIDDIERETDHMKATSLLSDLVAYVKSRYPEDSSD